MSSLLKVKDDVIGKDRSIKFRDFPDISFINLNPPKLTRLQQVKRFIRRLLQKG